MSRCTRPFNESRRLFTGVFACSAWSIHPAISSRMEQESIAAQLASGANSSSRFVSSIYHPPLAAPEYSIFDKKQGKLALPITPVMMP